jgi:hypothetical protein
MKRSSFFLAVALIISPSLHSQHFSKAIEDNSFLIEEAYNQENRVVQHISTMMYSETEKKWEYAFSQEWPAFSQRHQLSYTLPYSWLHRASSNGIGDIAVHYRFQALRHDDWITAAPRLTVVFPTGNDRKQLGEGKTSFAMNLPLSKRLSEQWVVHANVGASVTPGVRVVTKKNLWTYTIGGSVIWLTHSNFNLLVEEVSLFSDEVENDRVVRHNRHFVSPGVRAAVNAGNLQIVPGAAVPIRMDGNRSVQTFFYLSFEHTF